MTYRNIDTQIWRDDWFIELSPDEKLLFIYLFSNDSTFLTGLYKINKRIIAFETGLEIGFINQTLDKFQDAEKVFYEDGVIWVVNLQHYNASRSPKVEARIQYELSKIPECRLKITYMQANNRVSIPYEYPIDTSLPLTNQSKPLTESESLQGENSANSFPAIPNPELLEGIFTEVTGLITFPSGSRANDLERLDKIYRVEREKTVDYLRPYWQEWTNRNYNKSNTAWLDWAVSRQIPAKRNKTEKPYIPEEHASEVY